MEYNRVLLPSLVVGVGIGVGLGLATRRMQTTEKWNTSSQTPQLANLLELELMGQIHDGRESTVTFNDFPYYLSEQTKILLTNAAYVHLKQANFTKFTRNLSPASRAILLTGPPGTDLYRQTLAKALSHFSGAKLLLLDVRELSLKMQVKYGDLQAGNVSQHYSRGSTETVNRSLSRVLDTITISKKERLSCKENPGDRKERESINSPEERCHLRDNSTHHNSISKEVQTLGAGSAKALALKGSDSWVFGDKLLLSVLFKVLSNLIQVGPVILYLHNVERWIFKKHETYLLFQEMISKLSGPILILGSALLASSLEEGSVHNPDEKLWAALFPYNIDVKPPEDSTKLACWKSQLEKDMKTIRAQENQNHISEVLLANDVVCDGLASISFSDTLLLSTYIEEIVICAISHHLMNTEEPEYRTGRLVLSSESLAYALSTFQAGQMDGKDAMLQIESNSVPAKDFQEVGVKTEGKIDVDLEIKVETERMNASDSDSSKPDSSNSDASKKGDSTANTSKTLEVPPDNEFEKHIRSEVIPAGEVGISFMDIGALDNVKEALQELVMLPLRRPDFFNREGLIKPCKGILLFGPPGTGKTMLAKAVATEAGATFINVTMSTITSKWFGEDEKNVKALFTLAAKVAPTVIFIDEVDSMLGQRSRMGEHEVMRKIKNEFMAHWDGLRTNCKDRILVLAATNRPSDLDEAIIRRFERRIMVGLPNVEHREKILRAILAKEKLEKDFDFKELAVMTDGYSGSDLKNLCMAAAYRPIREILHKEKVEHKGIKLDGAQEANASACPDSDGCELSLRPLTMKDMMETKNQVSASFAAEGAAMAELQEWNELYGEGGSRKKQQLTYFL
eukprot:c27701_g1_i2 orf=434-2992(+)